MERRKPGCQRQPCLRRAARVAACFGPRRVPYWSPRRWTPRFPRRRWPPPRRRARPPCGPAPARTARRWRRPGSFCARTAARLCEGDGAEVGARPSPSLPAATFPSATGTPACRRRRGAKLPAPKAPFRRAHCSGMTPCAACPGDGRPARERMVSARPKTPPRLISHGCGCICGLDLEWRPLPRACRASDVLGNCPHAAIRRRFPAKESTDVERHLRPARPRGGRGRSHKHSRCRGGIRCCARSGDGSLAFSGG